MSRRSSSARSSRYHPPQGSFLLRVLREVFDPYKKSMLVLDSSAVEWSRPCRTTRSGHGPRRLRTARWLPLGVAQEMDDILARRMAGPLDDRILDGGPREEPIGIGLDTGLACTVFPETRIAEPEEAVRTDATEQVGEREQVAEKPQYGGHAKVSLGTGTQQPPLRDGEQ